MLDFPIATRRSDDRGSEEFGFDEYSTQGFGHGSIATSVNRQFVNRCDTAQAFPNAFAFSPHCGNCGTGRRHFNRVVVAGL
jgi:hypothetical protein